MNFVIVDLEATYWENNSNRNWNEIIEIGAVMFSFQKKTFTLHKEFSKFVRPVAEPFLSKFCTKLTSITQQDVNNADPFSLVFPEFLAWIGDEPFTLCSWGFYDINQFRVDCNRHSFPFPESFLNHINLKKEFAKWRNCKSCGMAKALDILNMPLNGIHHRGLDDARNITQIAQLMLPDILKLY